MRYSKNLSIIYDAIMYGVLYFYEDEYYADTKNFGYDTDIAFEFYTKTKDKIDIPDIFRPLYHRRSGELTFLTEFVLSRYDPQEHNLHEIFADKRQIYEYLIEHYFPLKDDLERLKHNHLSPILINEYVNQMSIPIEVKVSLIALLLTFDQVIGEYVILFADLYNKAVKLHASNSSTITAVRSETKMERNLSVLANAFCVSTFDISSRLYATSLLNPFMFFDYNDNIFLGSRFNEVLEDWDKFHHVTVKSFCNIFSTDITQGIYQRLCDQREANATDISKILSISVKLASKNLFQLFCERAVIISKNTGNDVYYTLNTDYLNYGKSIRDAYLEYTKKASVESFAKLAANDIRYTAIEKLIEHGRLTSTQLGRMTKTSDAAMHKNLKILLNEGIVEIGEKTAKEIYYVINKEYLKHLKINMEDKAVYFDQIITK